MECWKHMDKHLFLYICYNLNIFLYSIFNIAQRGISGRHAFLKPESSQNGQWNLRMVGQSGPQLGDRERGEGRTGWGRGQQVPPEGWVCASMRVQDPGSGPGPRRTLWFLQPHQGEGQWGLQGAPGRPQRAVDRAFRCPRLKSQDS